MSGELRTPASPSQKVLGRSCQGLRCGGDSANGNDYDTNKRTKRVRAPFLIALIIALFAVPVVYAIERTANDTEATTDLDTSATPTQATQEVVVTAPDPSLTPGETYPNVTQATKDATICWPNLRPPESFGHETRLRVFATYNVAPEDRPNYEIDFLIPSNLGGTAGVRNLWPRLRMFASGDANDLNEAVCDGRISLKTAREIRMADWTGRNVALFVPAKRVAPTVRITCPTSASGPWTSVNARFGHTETSGSSPIVAYEIWYGDGGHYGPVPTPDQVFEHRYEKPGTFKVTVFVRNEQGLPGSAECTHTWLSTLGRSISGGAGGCNSNYSGCVPNASDVDCAGGGGDGPAYVNGPVRVIGGDVYRLDRDGDGIGCDE